MIFLVLLNSICATAVTNVQIVIPANFSFPEETQNHHFLFIEFEKITGFKATVCFGVLVVVCCVILHKIIRNKLKSTI